MATNLTRINNNQISSASAGNAYLGINAAVKVQSYTITGGLLANNLTYGNNLTISGNLTVNGTTTSVNTVNTIIADPLIVLADGQTTGTPTVDIGFVGLRGNQNSAVMAWKESQSQFVAALSNTDNGGTSFSNTTFNINSYADFKANNITANANLSVTGNITVSGNVIGNLTVSGNIAGGNLLTTGLVSATANVTGGNVITGGLISATGNVYTGNIINAGSSSAVGNVIGGNLLTGGLITATGNITGGNLLTAGIISSTGTATVGNLAAGNTLFANATANSTSFGNSLAVACTVVAFNSTTSILMPVGNTAQRPTTAAVGMLRFNSAYNSFETFYANAWSNVGAPVFTVIADEQFTGNGSQTVYTLSSTQTTNSCIVSINGVVQIPTTAYAVSGNVLTFTEAPAVSDLIDVRELTTTTTVSFLQNGNAVVLCNATPAGGEVDITGNLIANANATYDLGSSTNAWRSLYVGGNTIYLGNLQLKESPANTFVVYQSNGTTPANITLGNVAVTGINDGTSSYGFSGVNGNAQVIVAGNTIETVTPTGISVTGNIVTNSGGFIGVGTSTPDTEVTILGTPQTVSYPVTGNSTTNGTDLHITGADSSITRITQDAFGTSTYVAFTGRSGRGTAASPSQTLTSDVLGQFTARGYSNGALQFGNSSSGRLDIIAAGNFTDSSRPTNLAIYTTSPGNILPAQTALFDYNGNISATGNVTGAYLLGNASFVTGLSAFKILNGTSQANIGSANGNLNITIAGTNTINFTTNGIENAQANAVGNIGTSSNYFNTIFGKATTAQYADLAEMYLADAEYAAGTVVSFGGEQEITLATTDADRRIAGVISTQPAYMMNSTLQGEHTAYVALTGRVPCSVVGTVTKGDMMVSAGNGAARAEANPVLGTVIGKALENFHGESGVIEVVVGRL